MSEGGTREPRLVAPELWFAVSVVVNFLRAVVPERAEHDPLRLASLLVGGVLVLTIMRRASLYGSRAVRWAGRAPRLWKSVVKELQVAEEMTRDNDVLTLTMCVNYGGRAELADAARSLAREVAAGRLDPERIDEKRLARHLYLPDLPDADLVWRTSGEQRLSNFMLWQAAYSEMVFTDVLWPDVDRRALWRAIEIYAERDRRFGGALPNPEPPGR